MAGKAVSPLASQWRRDAGDTCRQSPPPPYPPSEEGSAGEQEPPAEKGEERGEGINWYLVKRDSLRVGHDHSTDGGTDIVESPSVPPDLSRGKQSGQHLVVVAGGGGGGEKENRRHGHHLWLSGTALAMRRPAA